MQTITFTTRGVLRKSALREANERLVLNAIRQNPGLSRPDLARLTGLSPSSMAFILSRLKRGKTIEEKLAAPQSRVGRRPSKLWLRPEARMVVGLEIGLQETRVALADLTGHVVEQKVAPWHPHSDIYLGRMRSLIRRLVATQPPDRILGVGVGVPGTVDRASGTVVAAQNLDWFNFDAGSVLRKELPVPFYFENNARLCALGEIWFSKPGQKPLQEFVFVTVRGGLGTGVVVNGHLLTGAASAAAEFGHTMLHPEGRPCVCGNRGCWEQYASDRALCRLYAERSGAVESGGQAETIVQAAREGDPTAREAVHDTAREVALGFANLIMGLNPEAIVLDGYLAAAWDLIQDSVWGVLRQRLSPRYLAGVRIFPTRHPKDACLLGALALVLSRFFATFNDGAAAMRHEGR